MFFKEEKMKKIIKFILSKYDSFWTPVVIAACGVVIYILRFFENFFEDHVPHLSAIAVLLLVISFILLVLGGPINWFKVDEKKKDEEKYMD
jgi:predicted PurR-regulated permease PerM